MKARVVEVLGGKCECCGIRGLPFLTLQRTAESEAYPEEERKTRTERLWALLTHVKYPMDRYRLLCLNCKGARDQDGSCPHEDIDA